MATRIVACRDIRNGMRIMGADGTAVVTHAEYTWTYDMRVICYGLTGRNACREFVIILGKDDTVTALV